jgi:hypothetical protein
MFTAAETCALVARAWSIEGLANVLRKELEGSGMLPTPETPNTKTPENVSWIDVEQLSVHNRNTFCGTSNGVDVFFIPD